MGRVEGGTRWGEGEGVLQKRETPSVVPEVSICRQEGCNMQKKINIMRAKKPSFYKGGLIMTERGDTQADRHPQRLRLQGFVHFKGFFLVALKRCPKSEGPDAYDHKNVETAQALLSRGFNTE